MLICWGLCLCVFQVEPYLPYEYTCEGMLERVHSYIQHQVRSMWRRILTERGTKHTHAEILSFIFSPSLSLTHAYTPVLKLPLCSIFHRCVCSTPRTLCISAGVCVCVCLCVTLYSMYVDLWLIYMLALITNHISALGLWGRRSTDTNEKGWVRRESISVGIMVMKHKDEERIFFNNPTLDVRQTAEGFFTAAGLSRENFTTAFILIKKRNRRNLN